PLDLNAIGVLVSERIMMSVHFWRLGDGSGKAEDFGQQFIGEPGSARCFEAPEVVIERFAGGAVGDRDLFAALRVRNFVIVVAVTERPRLLGQWGWQLCLVCRKLRVDLIRRGGF